MIRSPQLSCFALAAALLAAPAAHAANQGTAPPAEFNPHKIAFKPGAYRCELGRGVQVQTVSADQQSAVLRYERRQVTVRAVDARSGALRYEDADSGLVWLMIHNKAMLLDSKGGQRLATDCRI